MAITYRSTRGGVDAVLAAQAVVKGLAPDGGLFVPARLPSGADIYRVMQDLPYHMRAAMAIAPFMSGYETADIEDACRLAYGSKFSPEPARVVSLDGNTHVLELFNGPTLAFKDLALQLMPRLLTLGAKAQGVNEEIFILVATSGDTGKAALEGFCDVPGVRVAVFYPQGGVSAMQELQMVTQQGDNMLVIAVEGNFDDAQTGIKKLFGSGEFSQKMKERGAVLSSANSMNWGRLVPQIAYYFSAYADLVSAGHIKPDEFVNVAVPTGNFGNILAAHYAREMGLPLARLICASNRNNVLADFINTGKYSRNREFYRTTSPSMDILVSSNLERLLYELANQDVARVKLWMQQLAEGGEYDIGETALSTLNAGFSGGWCGDERALQAIGEVFNKHNYLLDPHTAVAYDVLSEYRKSTGDNSPAIVVATASPFKFPADALRAIRPNESPADEFAACARIEAITGLPIPDALRDLHERNVLHTAVCTPAEMEATLLRQAYK